MYQWKGLVESSPVILLFLEVILKITQSPCFTFIPKIGVGFNCVSMIFVHVKRARVQIASTNKLYAGISRSFHMKAEERTRHAWKSEINAHLHGIKGFVIPTKSFVKIGTTKIFCYNNKMFRSVNKTFDAAAKFWLQQQKIICCPLFP